VSDTWWLASASDETLHLWTLFIFSRNVACPAMWLDAAHLELSLRFVPKPTTLSPRPTAPCGTNIFTYTESKNVKAYILETKVHWTKRRNMCLIIFNLISTDTIFVGLCEYYYRMRPQLDIERFTKAS
jgi:hypothetical protein